MGLTWYGCAVQELTTARYSPSFSFRDPISSSTSLAAFQQNLRVLRTVFDLDFVLHSVRSSQDEVTTRCGWHACCLMGTLRF
jgi:hypothetical protein